MMLQILTVLVCLAQNIATETVIVKSPDPEGIFCFTPAICEGLGGRLVAAVDFGGPGTDALEGPRSQMGDYDTGNQIRVLLSDDGGDTWRQTPARLPMMHEILFRDGRRLYMLGHCGPLVISVSEDNGESWSAPAVLCDEPRWHQSNVAIDVHRGRITLVYEKMVDYGQWPGVGLHLLQGRCGSDLTKASNWRFSPMYYAENAPLETNTLRIRDRRNPLYEPDSWILLSRCGDGSVGKAVMMRARRLKDGSLAIEALPEGNSEAAQEGNSVAPREGDSVATREGKRVDLPGGNMKFDIVYDAKSRLYWMVHSVNVPGQSDRRTLGLSYSRDLFDWEFAGTVAHGGSDKESRHYASLIAYGRDLLIVSRSGDSQAACAHDTDIITFHKVTDFRKLAKF